MMGRSGNQVGDFTESSKKRLQELSLNSQFLTPGSAPTLEIVPIVSASGAVRLRASHSSIVVD
jgi:hypothetical protein